MLNLHGNKIHGMLSSAFNVVVVNGRTKVKKLLIIYYFEFAWHKFFCRFDWKNKQRRGNIVTCCTSLFASPLSPHIFEIKKKNYLKNSCHVHQTLEHVPQWSLSLSSTLEPNSFLCQESFLLAFHILFFCFFSMKTFIVHSMNVFRV